MLQSNEICQPKWLNKAKVRRDDDVQVEISGRVVCHHEGLHTDLRAMPVTHLSSLVSEPTPT